MLTFVNRCPRCGHVFETEGKITDPERPACPLCGSQSRRDLQPSFVKLLGDNWAADGYCGEQGFGLGHE